jgi:hypothetical protein
VEALTSTTSTSKERIIPYIALYNSAKSDGIMAVLELVYKTVFKMLQLSEDDKMI